MSWMPNRLAEGEPDRGLAVRVDVVAVEGGVGAVVQHAIDLLVDLARAPNPGVITGLTLRSGWAPRKSAATGQSFTSIRSLATRYPSTHRVAHGGTRALHATWDRWLHVHPWVGAPWGRLGDVTTRPDRH